MKTSIGTLRSLVREAKAGASPEYMQKEKLRERLQTLIVDVVKAGTVGDQGALDETFKSLDMALKALKMVPFEVWQRLSSGASGEKKAKQ